MRIPPAPPEPRRGLECDAREAGQLAEDPLERPEELERPLRDFLRGEGCDAAKPGSRAISSFVRGCASSCRSPAD